MSKKLKDNKSPEESGDMDMSPMIDMVFLLLIFFVVNATAITVKKDGAVKIPVASSSGELESANGCIVINIYGKEKPKGFPDTVVWGTDTSKPLSTEQELAEYIKTKAEAFKRENYDLRLYLRGDKDALFKGARSVIRVGGSNGVSNVIFGVVPGKN
ncbi:MAG: biopolymer transporter ExbD [Akkermansia sp.]